MIIIALRAFLVLARTRWIVAIKVGNQSSVVIGLDIGIIGVRDFRRLTRDIRIDDRVEKGSVNNYRQNPPAIAAAKAPITDMTEICQELLTDPFDFD